MTATVTAPKTTQRKFDMHAKLLYDNIFNQAGTLSKAILEGVMNFVDAKATRGSIEIKPDYVSIVDDGEGIKDIQHIVTRFEQFAYPHDDSEAKVFGKFRIGRGQIFAYGKTRWRTGTFEMRTDVKHKGLDYELTEGLPSVNGCTIEIQLYDPLSGYNLHDTVRDLEAWTKWCPVPVYIQGQLASTPVKDNKWQKVSANAYISLTAGGDLAIYNQGIHVMNVPGWKYGTGGEIVTKKPVKVNYARNDVHSDCDVWQNIRKQIQQLVGTQLRKKKSLNDNERQRLADDYLTGLLSYDDFAGLRLFTCVTGRQCSWREVCRSRTVTVAPHNSVLGDTAHRRQLAFVLSDVTLSRFRAVDVASLLSRIADLAPYSVNVPTVVNFAEISKGINGDYEVITKRSWSGTERIWMDLIHNNHHYLCPSCTEKRTISIGKADCANAWTDGISYIVIGRNFLKSQSLDIKGFTSVGRILLHEYCHYDCSTDTHDHTQEFYELFHDEAQNIGAFVQTCMTRLPRALRKEQRNITRKLRCDYAAIDDAATECRRLADAVAESFAQRM